jgi:methylenetetrahydrofolate dehydrogenase (NADP+)/methenyltetrahydrofolate cyclohydrolase
VAAQLIDGKAIATRISDLLAGEVKLLAGSRPPGLGVVLVGDDPASRVYVNMKKKACAKLGLYSEEVQLESDVDQVTVLSHLARYNADPKIDGILVQLPLPPHLDSKLILESVRVDKDVDCFHPVNVGRLFLGQGTLFPCTPLGVIRLLSEIGYDPKGRRAVVVGRSNIVGKPVAMMLMQRHATVTICHTRTRDLAGEVSRADLVIAAAGVPAGIKGEWIAPGAVVIDVGVNRVGEKLVGDVEFEIARERASFLTPVPGGVGPMTIAMLMHNTVQLARAHLARQEHPSCRRRRCRS